ncbi:MAG: glycoside hydrolase family 3 C-terminal domain-containing protein [Defluviitaleaceae bacterium]|nr:glycoside hydrolase family 3 C-terminal domain-containing protein [Defluviitaleaceae bacterium]
MKKYQDKSLSAQERAEALVAEMTLEEKASQLNYKAAAIPRLDIPSYNWWNEGLHGLARAGTATMFPQAIALAATFDEKTLHDVGEITSIETRAKYNMYSKLEDRDIYKGLTLWSPNINIFRDPRWGRGHETYGEDTFLTGKLGVAFVKGIQGDGSVMRAAACAKHYAVHSGPEGLRHSFDAKASMKDMEETYLPHFEALVKAGVEGVMGAYNRVNSEGACASDFLMGKLDEWGFDGYFVSDYRALEDFHTNHGLTGDVVESAALALKKGCHVCAGYVYEHVMTAYEKNLVTEEDITKAAIAAMRTRIRLGLFDDKTEYDDIPFSVISCKEHHEKSLDVARKSMVLLKNNGILPLDAKKYKTIGVIGPNADSRDALIGNYFGTADKYVTFLDGITEAFDGRVYYSWGCGLVKASYSGLALQDGDRYSEAVGTAEQSDVVILCVGLDANLEGEEGDAGNEFDSGDKFDLRLPQSQRTLIEKVLAVGKPTIIVIASGSSLNVEGDKADAIIQAWYPGARGGIALADILFGKVSPSGKLPLTFYEDSNLLPAFDDYATDGRTYRFIDLDKGNVLYPFGFGLTYSKVECTDISYNRGVAKVKVKNAGTVDTEDVVQIYIKDCKSKHAVKNHKLCGFARVYLKAGRDITVEIPIDSDAFTIVDDSGKRFIDSDNFILFAGTSQPDVLSQKLSGTGCVSVDVKL